MNVRIEASLAGSMWTFAYLDPAGAVFAPPRTLGSAPNGTPFLSPAECAALHHAAELAADQTGVQVSRARDRIARREQTNLRALGEYLFAVLLGEATWAALGGVAHRLELALPTTREGALLASLPWELCYREGTGYLAALPGLSLVRRVRGSATVPRLESPMRVLFVVGASASDDRIRAGAEYLGVMRYLDGITAHLLLEATPDQVIRAVRHHRPFIVHFICHGGMAPEPYLELRGDDGQTVKASADALITALRADDGSLPAMVVLNACYTATGPTGATDNNAGQVSSPLAMQLIERGVAIVVGMAGAIADQACRLFARRLFEAIGEGRDFIAATADGRRFGLANQSLTGADWAFATVFMSETASQSVPVVSNDHVAWRRSTNLVFRQETFPSFCDRWKLWRLFDLLLSSGGHQARELDHNEMRALLLRARDARKLGKTRTLREFAVRGVRAGHVVIHVTDDAMDRKAAANPTQLVSLTDWRDLVVRAARTFAAGFQWAWAPAARASDAAELADELREILDSLLTLARQECPNGAGERRLLLLVDNTQLLGGDLAKLLDSVLTLTGLNAHPDLRVVFTYTDGAGRETFASDLKAWRERWSWAHEFELQPFEPGEASLAYQQYLLGWRAPSGALRPLIARNAEQFSQLRTVLDQNTSGGVPGLLTCPEVKAIISALETFGMLLPANDDDFLLALQTPGGQQ